MTFNHLNIDHESAVKVLDLACGNNHTLLLATSEHTRRLLLVFGAETGLGFGDLRDSDKPLAQTIPMDQNEVEKVFASCERSLVLTEQGKVFFWGEDFFGKRADKATLMHDFQTRVLSLAVGFLHALAVVGTYEFAEVEGFEVFSWGDGSYGELGHGDCNNRETPTRIEYFGDQGKRPLKVAAGSRFSVVKDVQGAIYTFGSNSVKECGRLGERCLLPERLSLGVDEAVRPYDIFAGASHAACITSTLVSTLNL